ncbi:MAG: DNA polymerase III subunit beta [Clostridia bacterium]|nr:DNA polymerase III subunit beta [Clostridia bacterium]
MLIKCHQEELLKAVNIVSRAVATSTPIPILTGIFITAEDSSLTLEATDMEIRIRHRFSVQVLEEGKVVIPAKHFTDLVKKLPGTTIEIGTLEDDTSIYIKYEKSQVKLLSYEIDEFPEINEELTKPLLSMDSELLSESIRQVSIATSRDESRPVFTGTLFNLEDDGSITMVATDSHRLAVKKIQPTLLEEDISSLEIIIPSKVLGEVGRIWGDIKEDLHIGFSESHVFFKGKDTFIYSRLIDGVFPNYKDVIPEEIKTQLLISTDLLYESLGRASLMSRGEFKGRGSIIKIKLEGNNIHIHSFSSEIGEVNETITSDKDGEDMEIAFNVKYMLDVFKVLNSEKAKIEFSGSLSPALVKPSESNSYLYLVLPIRIQ